MENNNPTGFYLLPQYCEQHGLYASEFNILKPLAAICWKTLGTLCWTACKTVSTVS